MMKLEDRKNHMFILFTTKQLLNKLKADREVEEAIVSESTSKFYETGLSYLNMWQTSFDKAVKFTCISLKS